MKRIYIDPFEEGRLSKLRNSYIVHKYTQRIKLILIQWLAYQSGYGLLYGIKVPG